VLWPPVLKTPPDRWNLGQVVGDPIRELVATTNDAVPRGVEPRFRSCGCALSVVLVEILCCSANLRKAGEFSRAGTRFAHNF
jgi:hypothetical protein